MVYIKGVKAVSGTRVSRLIREEVGRRAYEFVCLGDVLK